MLKFVRSGRKETTYSAGLHPVIKAGLRADKGKHTVFVPFRLESINTQHNIGVLVSGNGYSHGIIVTDPTREGKKFKITSNVDRYNIYIDGQKYDGRELDFGQIYTLSFSAELGTLVHLGASKLVTADFYQGIKVFSEKELLGAAVESEHTEWAKKYGEEKTKTLAAIEAAKLVPVQPAVPSPTPANPSPANPSPAVPETPKQANPNIPNNNIFELGEADRAKFGIYTFSLATTTAGSQTAQSDGAGELTVTPVSSNPPVPGYIFFATDNEEDKGQPHYVAQTDKPVKKPAETSSENTTPQPAATEQPAVTQPQPVAPASPQPTGESEQTGKPAVTETGNQGAVAKPETTSPSSETAQAGNTENATATQPAPANSETETTTAVTPSPAPQNSGTEHTGNEEAKPVNTTSGESGNQNNTSGNTESSVTATSGTGITSAVNTPKESEAQTGQVQPTQPATGSEGNNNAVESPRTSSDTGHEASPPANSEDHKANEARGIYVFNLKNATEESIKSDGEGLTVRAVSTSTPVVGYKLLVKEEQQ